MNVRAWLYRVAHNRCIDHLRRPIPPPAEIFEMSRKPLHDPVEEAQRRDDLRQLVADVGQLPDQQRSALLMREIDGMTYADLAVALDVTVPAVKSLLVRARVGLVVALEARDADCVEIRTDLLRAYDKGVKASGRARKHMRTCDACTEYRGALRGMRRSFAALTPLGAGPLAFAAKLIGLGGSAGGAAAGAAGGGSAAVAGGGLATATACKVAAVVCTAAIATGGAVEVNHKMQDRSPAKSPPAKAVKERAAHPPAAPAIAPACAPVGRPQVQTLVPDRTAASAAAPVKRKRATSDAKPKADKPAAAPVVALQESEAPVLADETLPPDPQAETGGVRAPDAPEAPVAVPTEPPAPVAPIAGQPQPEAPEAIAGTEQAPAPVGGASAPDAAPPAG